MLPDRGQLAYVVVPKALLWTPAALGVAGALLLGAGAAIDNAAIALPGLAMLVGAIPAGIAVLLRRRRLKWRVGLWPMVLAIALGVIFPPLELYYWATVQDNNMARGPNPANQSAPQ